MFLTFENAKAFDKQLAWDTSKVTNMQFTFYAAGAFNQALDWDTSKVTNMYGMFQNAEAFKPEGLVWETSQVTDFTDFGQCAALVPENPNCV